MRKHIKPLKTFKKVNKKYYEILSLDIEGRSAKDRENEMYFRYAFYNLYPAVSSEKGFTSNPDPIAQRFFYSEKAKRKNISTVTEIGRLMLTGWYYNIEKFSEQIGIYIYNAYQRKIDKNEKFNDLDFSKVVNNIREDIGYYSEKPEAAKLLILESLFKDELEKLLPPPEEVQKINTVKEFLDTIHRKRLKANKNWYIENYELLDEYSYYLSEILDTYDIAYESLEQFNERREKEGTEYYNKLEKTFSEYKESLLQNIPPLLSDAITLKAF